MCVFKWFITCTLINKNNLLFKNILKNIMAVPKKKNCRVKFRYSLLKSAIKKKVEKSIISSKKKVKLNKYAK